MRNGLRWMSWALLLGALTAGRAEADYVNFAFLGNGISGAGALAVTPNGDGNYTAVSGQLTTYGGVIPGTSNLLANPNGTNPTRIPGFAGSSFGFLYDNQLLLTQAFKVNYNGLLFTSGTYQLNLFYEPSSNSIGLITFNTANRTQSFVLGLNLLVSAVQPGTPPVIPAITPEPSSLALCGVAGLILAGVGRARRRAAA